MVRTLRGAIVVLAVALLGFLAAPASNAAVSPSPSPSASVTGCGESQPGYPAPCLMSVQVTPVCVEDVPVVSYNVLGTAPDVTSVDVTLVNPSGANVVLAHLPLHGTLLTHAAFVKAGILIRFAAGPQAQATAVYPASTTNCSEVLDDPDPDPTSTPSVTPTETSEVLAEGDPTPVANQEAVLSATGSNDAPLLVAAIALVVIGAAAVTLVTISRRRRSV
jgi:hypothetical protein